MAQFDVYRNSKGSRFPLVLDVQTDLLAQLDTRVVVPLTPREGYSGTAVARVTPIVVIDRVEYVLMVPLLAAIPKAVLGKSVASLALRRVDVITALDLLLTGS